MERELNMTDSCFTAEELAAFAAGNYDTVYEKLGAHPVSVDGVSGVYFAVWAPNAERISVVGDFNGWDGNAAVMKKAAGEGIFELFIPAVQPGAVYKYRIEARGTGTFLKSDPYGFAFEKRPATASIVAAASEFAWEDDAWMEARKERRNGVTSLPLNIYELHPGCFGKETYPELGEMLSAYAADMHYTHVDLMPVMEHPLDESLGYQTTGFYAPTARGGSPEDFKAMVNTLHKAGIGVILDWSGARFPKDSFGLYRFDGTALYESPVGGDTAVFDFGRPEIVNFLIASVLFWIRSYHIDGFRITDMASFLYYTSGGSNVYGGGENLEGVNFIRKLTSAVKKEFPEVILIADGSAEWPMTTRSLKDDGLGFDLRMNTGWNTSFFNYIEAGQLDKSERYGELGFPMLYQYSENFLLSLSHDAMAGSGRTLLHRIPGSSVEEKAADLRTALGFYMLHPGKKLLFSGQEFGAEEEWTLANGIALELGEEGAHKKIRDYVRALNSFYCAHPALWQDDNEPGGFRWINCHSWKENVIVFVRRAQKDGEDLLAAINFSNVDYPSFNIGIPYYGTFREVFNSEENEFGGSGQKNERALPARKITVDNGEDGIAIKLPAHAVIVFSCTKRERPEKKEAGEEKKAGKTGAKKTTAKKAKGAAGIADSLRKRAGAVLETAGAVRDMAGNAVKETAGAVLETAGTVRDMAGNAVKEGAEAVLETAGTVRDMAGNAVKEGAEAVFETAGTVRDMAGNAVKETAEAVIGTARAISESVQSSEEKNADESAPEERVEKTETPSENMKAADEAISGEEK